MNGDGLFGEGLIIYCAVVVAEVGGDGEVIAEGGFLDGLVGGEPLEIGHG